MKERPILMSAPMVRALLEGRKTQTRRIVKAQPHRIGWYTQDDKPGVQFNWHEVDEYSDPLDSVIRCPYGAPGDQLWIKETHAVDVPGCERGLSYRADHQDPKGDGPANPMRWIPSIHMRREYSRLTLEVTSVRVERVQDISDTDAIAEGLIPVGGPNGQQMWAYSETTGGYFADPRVAFRMLWHSINGAASWDANPWVWVVGFKVVT